MTKIKQIESGFYQLKQIEENKNEESNAIFYSSGKILQNRYGINMQTWSVMFTEHFV